MRVHADLGKCQGYANCVIAAPAVFDLDESGLVTVLVDLPSEDQHAALQEAVRSCPAEALRIEDV